MVKTFTSLAQRACLAGLTLIAVSVQAGDGPARHRVLHNFTGSDGAVPTGGALLQGADGFFYGTAYSEGKFQCGVAYRISPHGKFRILHHFRGGKGGCYPRGGLMQAADGSFYGTTYGGGRDDVGTIFRMDTAGRVKTLHSFRLNDGAGRNPSATLVQAGDGLLYGMTTLGGPFETGGIFSLSTDGLVRAIYSFGSRPDDASNPWGGLVRGPDERLYGVSYSGGKFNAGTIFAMSTSGEYTLLHEFDGKYSDTPFSTLMVASNGKLYGSTLGGGSKGWRSSRIFAISTQGEFEIIWRFEGSCKIGCMPKEAPLIEDANHRLYGTASMGGKFENGSVFSLALDGTDARHLHSFNDDIGYAAGRDPMTGLTLGRDGRLYGTTAFGGGQGGGVGSGTVFSLKLR